MNAEVERSRIGRRIIILPRVDTAPHDGMCRPRFREILRFRHLIAGMTWILVLLVTLGDIETHFDIARSIGIAGVLDVRDKTDRVTEPDGIVLVSATPLSPETGYDEVGSLAARIAIRSRTERPIGLQSGIRDRINGLVAVHTRTIGEDDNLSIGAVDLIDLGFPTNDKLLLDRRFKGERFRCPHGERNELVENRCKRGKP